jgi:hypothetical protein
MGKDNTTGPSKAPVAGCAARVSASVGMRGVAPNCRRLLGAAVWDTDRLGGSPTPVAGRNAGHRLPGGTPCAGEPHARCGRGREETRR